MKQVCGRPASTGPTEVGGWGGSEQVTTAGTPSHLRYLRCGHMLSSIQGEISSNGCSSQSASEDLVQRVSR